MKRENLLIVADSFRNADLLYAVRLFVPDPFIYLRMNGRCHMVVSDLEVARARRKAPHCRIIPLSHCWNRLARQGVRKFQDPARIIHLLLREKGIRKVVVPETFPLRLAGKLADLGIKLKIAGKGVFPERVFKTPDEVKKISAALLMAEVGLAEGIHALKQSRSGRGRKLVYRNAPLTSERLRAIIDTAILQAGGAACHTIVAGGAQGCDPHEPGSGQLLANEPIIIDVFPRSSKTGYHGDITRTVVRGRASEAVRKLYESVRRAQDLAIQQLKEGTRCRDLHQAVQQHFEADGYKSGRNGNDTHGFFHGTGHGIGLDLHETPIINGSSKDVLASRMAVTVEPGLYYPELNGGVRLEDVVLVTKGRPRNLTQFEKVLEV